MCKVANMRQKIRLLIAVAARAIAGAVAGAVAGAIAGGREALDREKREQNDRDITDGAETDAEMRKNSHNVRPPHAFVKLPDAARDILNTKIREKARVGKVAYTSSTLAVLAGLAALVDRRVNRASVSVAAIAEAAGVSRNTVMRHVPLLEAAGLVACVRTRSSVKRNTVNVYRLAGAALGVVQVSSPTKGVSSPSVGLGAVSGWDRESDTRETKQDADAVVRETAQDVGTEAARDGADSGTDGGVEIPAAVLALGVDDAVARSLMRGGASAEYLERLAEWCGSQRWAKHPAGLLVGRARRGWMPPLPSPVEAVGYVDDVDDSPVRRVEAVQVEPAAVSIHDEVWSIAMDQLRLQFDRNTFDNCIGRVGLESVSDEPDGTRVYRVAAEGNAAKELPRVIRNIRRVVADAASVPVRVDIGGMQSAGV